MRPIQDILREFHDSTEDHEKENIVLTLLEFLDSTKSDASFRATQEIIKLDFNYEKNTAIIKKAVSLLFIDDEDMYVMYPADILLALDRETVFSSIKEHEELHGPSKNIRSQAAVRFIKTMFGDENAIEETIHTFSKLLDKDEYQLDIWFALISLSHYTSKNIMGLFDRAMSSKNIVHILGKEAVEFRAYIARQDIENKVVNTMKKYFVISYSDSSMKFFSPKVYFPFEFRNYPGWGEVKTIQQTYFAELKSMHNGKLEKSIKESSLRYWSLWGRNFSLQELYFIWIENPHSVRCPLELY